MSEKSTKQIQNEIWSIKGEKVFSGKDTLVFVNRFTGEVKEFELVKTSINKGFIIPDDPPYTSEIDPEESYGSNGFHRAKWIDAKITEQTNEVDEN